MTAKTPCTCTNMATSSAATAAAFLAFCLCLSAAIPTKVVRLRLIPRDSPLAATANTSEASFLRGLTESDRVRLAIRRSHARAAAIVGQNKALAGGYQAPLSAANSYFVMELTIGSPPLRYHAVMDTGSDLIWTQCRPCVNCFAQPTPIFEPSTSSTYTPCAYDSVACRSLPQWHSSYHGQNHCPYMNSYGDGSWSTRGVLATEAFTISGAPFEDVAFGCGHDNRGFNFHPAAGIVGFGRGPLSLPSQFASSVGASGATFAYCLVFGTSDSSPLWLGPDARSMFPGGLSTSTPLLRNPFKIMPFYYVSLTGIDVAGVSVHIPLGAFDFRADGSGGLALDSGSKITFLETRTYYNLINVLKAAIALDPVDGSSVGMGLCYRVSEAESANRFPGVTLTFQGGANMLLLPRNYFLEMGDLLCAALAPTSRLSMIGNVAQRNFFILHDTSSNGLFFAPAQCDSL